MSGSTRKRKSNRDLIEETKFPAEISRKIAWRGKAGDSHLNGSDGAYWSDLEANDALKSIDSFECLSWEPLHEKSGAQKDDGINEDFNGISETTRVWGVGDSYSIRTSPGFDGRGQRNYRWSPKNSWRLSHRARSRSWSRSQSRSPVRDFKRESYGWSDRSRSGSGVLAQPCKDFAAGRCRRDGQCRFLHQDNLKNRDGGHSEIDPAENWGSRQEYRGTSRYANTEGHRNYPRDKASHGYGNFYDGERNEPLRNSSRSTNRYNDFLNGKFHMGSSRRYVHHGASGDKYDRSNRNAPFDHDRKHGPNRSGDTLCKYFAMGKCRNGDYCGFSHDGPSHSNPEGRSRDDRWGHDLDDENKSWGDSDVGDMNFTGATAAENSTYNRRGHNLDNENRSSVGPVWKDKAAERDEHQSSHWGSGSSGRNMGIPESSDKYDRSNRNAPFDHDCKHEPNRSGDTLCKYFAMGKCRNGNYCRFFHDGPAHSNPERRSRDDRWGHDLDDENKSWGDSDVGDMNFTDATTAENSTYNRWGHSLDNENRSSVGPVWKDKAAERDEHQSSHWGSGSSGANMDIPESSDKYDRSNRNAPFAHDRKHEPNRSGDTLCKYFAMGKCRNGNYCRFFHDGPAHSNPEGRSRDDRWGHDLDDENKSWGDSDVGDMNFTDATAAENSTYNRRGHSLDNENRLSVDPVWKDKASERDEHKSSHWGSGRSSGANTGIPESSDKYDRSNRNAPFDHNRKHEPNRNGDTLCKYFAMGKCRNGNYCRFSHDGPAHSNPKGRSRDDRWGHDLDDKDKSWGGLKWTDTAAVSRIAKFTGRGDSDVGNMNFTNATAAEKSTYNRWGHSLDNENRSSVGPVWKDKAAERDEHQSSHWGSGSSGANMGIPESMVATKLSVKEEPPFTLRGSQSQTLNRISIPAREQNITQEASDLQLAATVVHPTVSECSYVQQNVSKRGNNNAITASSNSPNDINFSGNIVHTVLVPGQSFKQDCDSLCSQPLSSVDETSQSQHTLSLNPSNGHTFDLNGPAQQINSPSNPQSPIQFCQGESVETPAMVESEVPRVTSGTPENEVTREQVTQITDLSVSLAQVFGNEQQLPHLNAALNPPNSTGSVPNLPNSASLSPPADSKAVQLNPATSSQEQYDSVGDSIDSSKPGNSNQTPPAFLSNPIERQDQVPSGPNSSEFNKSDSSEEELNESPKLKRQEPIAKSETKENSGTSPEECKQEQEIGHSESVDVDGRVEEGNRNKDEKEMLIFKIALVDFVKEILKPLWKEGRMSKEVHKTIVRKVVDKVIGTIQGVHIPKTKEKIDHYLSLSKPKITKLVQAYVEIYPKN